MSEAPIEAGSRPQSPTAASGSPTSVTAADLGRFVGEILRAAGADEESADATRRALIGASLRGVDSHGLRLLPHYVKVLEGGRVKGKPKMRFEQRMPATGQLDADHALGTAAGYRAMAEAMRLADSAGIGAVTAINSSHFAAAGAYSLEAAERGYIGMAFCNATSIVLAHDARKVFHGTNPISFAAPVDGERPYLIDMATSSIPFNRVLQYRPLDRQLPPDVVVDDDGQVTQDPHAGTQLLPLGGAAYGYKGAALAGMVDVLSAMLSGMKLSHQVPDMFNASWSEPRCLGQFFLAMKPAAFIEEQTFQAQMREYLDALRGREAQPGAKVMAAGDREWAVERQREVEGIPVDEPNLKLFAALAEKFGVAQITPL